MGIEVLTKSGAEGFYNSVENNKKIRVVGLKISEGDGSASRDTYSVTVNATALTGTSYPTLEDSYYAIQEILPGVYESSDSEDKWFLEYGFIIDPSILNNLNKVSLEIEEIGLFAQAYYIASAFVPTTKYTGNVSYVALVSNNVQRYYQCILSFPEDYSASELYLINDRVWYTDSAWKCLVDVPSSPPSSSNTTEWVSISTTPSASQTTDYWMDVTDSYAGQSEDEKSLPLIKSGSPFLYYYIVRNDYPLTLTKLHAINWNVRIGVTQDQASQFEVTFDYGDAIGLTQTELEFLASTTDNNLLTRDLARQLMVERYENES